MTKLQIQCKKCNHIIETNISMDKKAFEAETPMKNSTNCPKCRTVNEWSKSDVINQHELH